MRVIALDDLAGLTATLPGNPRLVVSGNFATPLEALAVFDRELAEYRLFMLNAQLGIPDRVGVTPESAFVGPGMRHSPRLHYVPCRLSLVPFLFSRTMPPDVVLIHTTPVANGAVSLGVEVNILPAAIEACRARGGIVIAQANTRMPFTVGDATVPVEAIDYLVEVDEPLPAKEPTDPDDMSLEIGERIAARVADGSTLQLGIGAVPDAVLHRLLDRRGLRVWTEMFSDGVLKLDAHGALDSNAKLTTSFIFGSQALYDWVDHNDRVHMVRTEHSNDPSLIARQPLMTSVNAALQVDLFGQANASRINTRIHSGFGGQTDFIVGALHAVGGQAFIAMKSWHPKAQVSTIVPLLDEPVTSFQHSAVVTENGVAEIWGYNQQEQARNLIEQAAHPDIREELWEEAAGLGLA
ncbi:MAG: acetyl-CoA hydrolase/transferase C-terminal domain-containing protein [Actinomycetes bacterium]